MKTSDHLSELVADLLFRAVQDFTSRGRFLKGINYRKSLGNKSIFRSDTPPQISLKDYFSRMNKYMKCSESCFVTSFIYIDRVLMRNSKFRLSAYNIHR